MQASARVHRYAAELRFFAKKKYQKADVKKSVIVGFAHPRTITYVHEHYFRKSRRSLRCRYVNHVSGGKNKANVTAKRPNGEETERGKDKGRYERRKKTRTRREGLGANYCAYV